MQDLSPTFLWTLLKFIHFFHINESLSKEIVPIAMSVFIPPLKKIIQANGVLLCTENVTWLFATNLSCYSWVCQFACLWGSVPVAPVPLWMRLVVLLSA